MTVLMLNKAQPAILIIGSGDGANVTVEMAYWNDIKNTK